jgi:hypothetical protein|tara:strand:- start:100 stop:561 length:462 start_codon:yes stop_codon:yes gene_type:complete
MNSRASTIYAFISQQSLNSGFPCSDKEESPYMNTTPEHDARFENMTFSAVYPLYVTKVEKKGRSLDELHQVIAWLTGFNEADLQALIKQKATFQQFFAAASINPNAQLIRGLICGYRVEEIETPLTQQVRWLDKLVDELAKGRKIEKILRSAE